jgi:hypothetical protein
MEFESEILPPGNPDSGQKQHALAHPKRRAMFERIIQSDEITVVELTRNSRMTQSGVSQHLVVEGGRLDRCST